MNHIEPKPMREIHEIMEKIYEKEKKMSKEEILKNIHEAAEELIAQKGLHLRKAKTRAKAAV